MSVVFFTDRDLGKQFPSILQTAGLNVECHRDHFAPDTPDEDWLEFVGKRNWVAVTHDQRIRHKPNERQAVIDHRVSLLVVRGAAPYAELARAFVSTLPRVLAFLSLRTPPFIAGVYRPSPAEAARGVTAGRVELLYPKA